MHEKEGVEIAKRVVSRMAKVYADEASHWDALQRWLDRRSHQHRKPIRRTALTRIGSKAFSAASSDD